ERTRGRYRRKPMHSILNTTTLDLTQIKYPSSTRESENLADVTEVSLSAAGSSAQFRTGLDAANVCFGSLADILDGLSDVRFTSESGRRSADWVRFVIGAWRSSTSRRGCFAVLFWRLEQSRSGGELPPSGSVCPFAAWPRFRLDWVRFVITTPPPT